MPRPALPPPITRVLLLTLLCLSLLNATFRLRSWTSTLSSLSPTQIATTPSNYLSNPQWAVPYLVIVPLRSLKYPWTIVTAAVVENNIVSLGISTAVLWFGGRYLERAWGGKEFGIFCAVVVGLSNAWSCLVYGAWHMLVGTPELYGFLLHFNARLRAFMLTLFLSPAPRPSKAWSHWKRPSSWLSNSLSPNTPFRYFEALYGVASSIFLPSLWAQTCCPGPCWALILLYGFPCLDSWWPGHTSASSEYQSYHLPASKQGEAVQEQEYEVTRATPFLSSHSSQISCILCWRRSATLCMPRLCS